MVVGGEIVLGRRRGALDRGADRLTPAGQWVELVRRVWLVVMVGRWEVVHLVRVDQLEMYPVVYHHMECECHRSRTRLLI